MPAAPLAGGRGGGGGGRAAAFGQRTRPRAGLQQARGATHEAPSPLAAVKHRLAGVVLLLLARPLAGELVLDLPDGYQIGDTKVKLPSGSKVGLSTRGSSAFRVRLMVGGERDPIDSPMIRPVEEDAPCREIRGHPTYGDGLAADFGYVLLDKKGVLHLLDKDRIVITASEPLGKPSSRELRGLDVIVYGQTMVNPYSKANNNARQRQRVEVWGAGESAHNCGQSCSKSEDCMDWVWTEGKAHGICEFIMGQTVGWRTNTSTTSGTVGPARMISLSTRSGSKLYGSGGGFKNWKLTREFGMAPLVENGGAFVPHYYSTDGYAALGAVPWTYATTVPLAFSSDDEYITWSITGPTDLYLMPAATLRKGTQAYYQLIGAPQKPPLFALGFTASRWGWANRSYIEETLEGFRRRKLPLDAFITDFEFYTTTPDYLIGKAGKKDFDDFGFSNATFPKPRWQLEKYRSDLHVRMGAIRKPRLGGAKDIEHAHQQHWMLGWTTVDGMGRNLNFSQEGLRYWYQTKQEHYLDDGIEFWWNDEGETDYWTYYWWNLAEISTLRAKSTSKRFFSLNRAFTPGMARLGAAVWTGDVRASWKGLSTTPGIMLNWALAGAPYVACDIGGFIGESEALMLTRWYQLGVFMPLMRIHSQLHVTPHWPWLWGHEYEEAMRKALELRYRLIPYFYSYAHTAYVRQELPVRPLVVDFPEDEKVVNMDTEWMFGDILVAPALTQFPTQEVYLPEGDWTPLGVSDGDVWTTTGGKEAIRGPLTLTKHTTIQDVTAYARAGTILALAPIVQHTGALPGGPLEVQVYAGADAFFTLVEDDGESMGYQEGKLRTVTFTWWDSEQILAWSVSGEKFDNSFGSFFIRVFNDTWSSRSKEFLLMNDGDTWMIAFEDRDSFASARVKAASDTLATGVAEAKAWATIPDFRAVPQLQALHGDRAPATLMEGSMPRLTDIIAWLALTGSLLMIGIVLAVYVGYCSRHPTEAAAADRSHVMTYRQMEASSNAGL